ncbi:MAG: hypothetical protein AB8G96_01265 [Phycisphaerales bacterium]
MLSRTALIVTAGVAIGAAVGWSKIMCPGGECMITGSWFGGGTIGGLLSFALAGFAVPVKAPAVADQVADGSDDTPEA